MTKTKYVEIEVDIDLTDWDDDELIAELSERGVSGYGGSCTDDDLRNIHELMKLNKRDAAYAAMYELIRNKLGVAI
jgi:hypothetical protein